MKYKRPLPTDAKLKAVARITRNTRKIFEGEGEILLEDGAVAVSAWGKYMKLPVDQIADEEFMKNQWYRLEEEDPEWV
ncbi:MAG: hotdog fold domain-containing protein, partial [Anaerovorax sp.]